MKRILAVISIMVVLVLGAAAQGIEDAIQKATFVDFLSQNWYWILVVLTEGFLRIWPTEKNYSIISMIFKVLYILFPNYKKEFKVDEKGNKVVSASKFII